MSRLLYLDALRGIAALLVVLTHLLEPLFGDWWLFRQWLDPGKLGVLWFFMISGMVIPGSLGPQGGVRRFVVSRFLRLYPAYWLSLLLYLAMLKLNGLPVPGWPQIAANLTMMQLALGHPDVIGLYWTLFIEWVFYGVCVLLYLGGVLHTLVTRIRCTLLFIAVAFSMAMLRELTDRKLPVALPLALALMFFGSIWRQWLLQPRTAELKRGLAQVLGAFTVVLPFTLMLAYQQDMGNGETWSRYLVTYTLAIVSFLLLTGCLRFQHPVLLWLGAVSYSVYLLHPSMALLAWHLLRGVDTPLLFVTLAMVLTLVSARVSLRFVETPFIQLGRYLNRRNARTHEIRV